MKFDNVSCSQCGRDFGPGDHGFSHCDQHPGYQQDMKQWRKQLVGTANMIVAEARDMDPLYDPDPAILAKRFRNYINELRDVVKEMDPPRKRSKK